MRPLAAWAAATAALTALFTWMLKLMQAYLDEDGQAIAALLVVAEFSVFAVLFTAHCFRGDEDGDGEGKGALYRVQPDGWAAGMSLGGFLMSAAAVYAAFIAAAFAMGRAMVAGGIACIALFALAAICALHVPRGEE